MILNFDKELAELRAAGVTYPDDKWMDVVAVLAKVLFKGRAAGIDHAVRIVQRRAVNPMPIVDEIRKPVR